MEPTQGSETSAYQNLTPGRYPKEYTQYSAHGEILKSSVQYLVYSPNYATTSAVSIISWDVTPFGLARRIKVSKEMDPFQD
jgi:hypothetical protein